MGPESQEVFNDTNNYENETDLFMCLTVLRGVYNSVGEAGEELMISTGKFNGKNTLYKKEKAIIVYVVAQHE